MAHNLEIIDGQASFFAARQPAWHGLGTVLPDNVTAEEAMKIAKLDWTPEIVPLTAMIDGFEVRIDGKNLVVREDPETGLPMPLGVVGDNYTIIPLEEAVAFAEALCEVSGAVWHTAGVLGHGERVFMLLESPNKIVLSNSDVIDEYFLIAKGNDGSMSLVAKGTHIRVVCQNTLNLSLKGTADTYKIRHTISYRNRMEEAIRALKVNETYVTNFVARAESMLATKMLDKEIDEFFRAVTNKNDERFSVAYEKISEVYHYDTQDSARGTAWGALNAVVEFVDFERSLSGSMRQKELGLLGVHELKQKALELLSN